MIVCVEEVQEVADEVGGGRVDILDHFAGFLEGVQGLGREGGAMSVRAVWIVEAVGGFVAVGIVRGDGREVCEELLEILEILEIRGEF